MPKVKYTSAKGLYQEAGHGIELTVEGSSKKSGTVSLLSGAEPYAESSTQLFPLGSKLVYGDRTFRYVFMNGACTAGHLLQQAAHVANHTNCTIINADAAVLGSPSGIAYSHAAGSRNICLDTVGTNLTADQYAEGYLIVNDQEGEGQLLKVRTHKAHVHGTDPSVVIETYDPLKTALVKASSQVSLIYNPYKDVVDAPAAETGAIVGATVIDMTDNYYGWAVTSGPAALLVSEAVLVVGHRAVRSNQDAGAVMAADSDPLLYPVGQVMGSGVVDTEYALVWLNIE